MKTTRMRDRQSVVLCASLFLAASAACSSDGGMMPTGTAGTTGGGGTGGAAGTLGAGGRGGTGGTGGMSGTSGAGNTCASGVPNGGPGGCTQGTTSVGTVVHAQSFTAYEGRMVKAAFTEGGEVRTATTSVTNGAFDLDFLFASMTCNLGADTAAGGALYIDVDGNSSCNPTTDFVFVWGARGGPAGTCRPIALTPQSAKCDSLTSFFPRSDEPALSAAQAVCPAVGNCLDFCEPQTQGTGGSTSVYCPTGGTGGRGGQGGGGRQGGG